MHLIVFTGTPGTGKSTLAKRFSKQRGYLYIDLNDFARHHGLYEEYDNKKKCYTVDTEELNKEFLGSIHSIDAKGIVVDSHLSHYLPSLEVDCCVVCTCSDLIELKQRLEKRGYNREKVRENLDAEIFKVCETEARELGHNVLVVDTKSPLRECLKEIENGVQQ